jgi:hypothetical protein
VGDHPVKVPAELVKEWMAEFYGTPTFIGEVTTGIADRAAQWGADQELEACEEWLLQERIFSTDSDYLFHLRAARRPKPPSLKQQALAALEPIERSAAAPVPTNKESLLLIRRALEALDA